MIKKIKNNTVEDLNPLDGGGTKSFAVFKRCRDASTWRYLDTPIQSALYPMLSAARDFGVHTEYHFTSWSVSEAVDDVGFYQPHLWTHLKWELKVSSNGCRRLTQGLHSKKAWFEVATLILFDTSHKTTPVNSLGASINWCKKSKQVTETGSSVSASIPLSTLAQSRRAKTITINQASLGLILFKK